MHLHFDLHKIHLLKNEINEIYITHTIQGFALALINIFIPIYLLQIGYPLNQIFIFYIVLYVSLLLFTFLTAYISTKFGLKHTLLIQLPFIIMFFLALNYLEVIKIPLFIIAIIGGLHEALYWYPLNTLFAKYSDRIKRSIEVSELFTFPKILSLFGPLLGGFIALTFGFHVLFVIVILLLFVSVFPLFYTKEVKPHVSFSFKKFLEFFKKDIKFYFGVTFSHVFSLSDSLIWPIFVFLTLASVISVGYIGTIAALGTIIFTLFIGKLSDKINKGIFLKAGAILLAGLWFLRIFIQTPLFLYLSTFLASFFLILIFVPFTAITFDKANKGNRNEFFLFREIFVNAGRFIVLVVALLAIGKFTFNFSLAGIVSFFFLIF